MNWQAFFRAVRRSDVVQSWPVLVLAAPAFVAVWSGWVELGSMTGFGDVRPLPGIADGFVVDTAITLPIGVEMYGAYALGTWLSHARLSRQTRWFAAVSAVGALLLGAAGQVAYHLLKVAGYTEAPWQITTIVACFPVLVLGMGATLAHLKRRDAHASNAPETVPETVVDAAPGTDPWPDDRPVGMEHWEHLSNTPGNVPENAGNALPWPPLNLTKPWPLPRPGDALVAVEAAPSSNGHERVPGPFPAQVNGRAAAGGGDEGDLDEETVSNAREAFSAELGNGESISVRQIMSRCNCGYPKAKRIKAVLDPE